MCMETDNKAQHGERESSQRVLMQMVPTVY